MLPYNHQFTSVVKQLNQAHLHLDDSEVTRNTLERYFADLSRQGFSLSPLVTTDNYFKSLTAAQQTEYVELVNIHLKAILEGLRASPISGASRHAEPPVRPETAPFRNTAEHPRVQVYVHETRHYHLWYDWGFWRPNYYYQTPRDAHRNENNNNNENKKQDKEQLSAGMILLAALLAATAIIATTYTAIEAGRAMEQIAYMEDVFGNMSKLAVTALGGVLGGSYGIAMGVALFEAPVFGAIVGSIIISGLAISAAKHLVEAVHASQNYDSALAYDPRFCLSNQERDDLKAKGYDTQAVSEALREIAIAYDKAHQKAWSLMFWSEENKQQAVMVDLMRELKQGFPAHLFTLNNKRFNLVAPTRMESMSFPNIVDGIVFEEPIAADGTRLGYQ